MLESYLKESVAVSGQVAYASSYSKVLTRFIVDSTIAVYRNSVYKTRNILLSVVTYVTLYFLNL